MKGDDALAAMIAAQLSDFEGREVRRSAIVIPAAGGGLRDPLAFEPGEWHKGERLYVLLECEVDEIRFKPIKSKGEDTGADMRVHILTVTDGGAAFVDGEFAREHLATTRERIQLLREKAQGISRLDFGGDADEAEAMIVQHRAGVHADGLRDGCVLCDEEIDAEQREKAAKPVPGTPADKAARAKGKKKAAEA